MKFILTKKAEGFPEPSVDEYDDYLDAQSEMEDWIENPIPGTSLLIEVKE